MKKLLSICLFGSLLTLGGCFSLKEEKTADVVNPPIVVPVDNEKNAPEVNIPVGTGNISGTGNIEKDKENENLDNSEFLKNIADEKKEDYNEFNEKGEFDQKKFQDDEIDEVMGLLKDLLSE